MIDRMKHALVASCVALTALAVAPNISEAAPAVRQGGNLGIGLGSGTLASLLSLKYFTGGEAAYQFNVGVYGYGDGRYYGNRGQVIALGFDYLFERPTIAGGGDFELAWNVGPGISGAFNSSGDWVLGASFVAGLEFLLNFIPIDIVLEWRPSLFFNSGRSYWRDNYWGGGNAGIDLVRFGAHIRFYF